MTTPMQQFPTFANLIDAGIVAISIKKDEGQIISSPEDPSTKDREAAKA
jgi:hypothetical protein